MDAHRPTARAQTDVRLRVYPSVALECHSRTVRIYSRPHRCDRRTSSTEQVAPTIRQRVAPGMPEKQGVWVSRCATAARAGRRDTCERRKQGANRRVRSRLILVAAPNLNREEASLHDVQDALICRWPGADMELSSSPLPGREQSDVAGRQTFGCKACLCNWRGDRSRQKRILTKKAHSAANARRQGIEGAVTFHPDVMPLPTESRARVQLWMRRTRVSGWTPSNFIASAPAGLCSMDWNAAMS